MSRTGKKVADVALKGGKSIDWEVGMAKLLVSDEARKEFATLCRTFDQVNSALQPKFTQSTRSIFSPHLHLINNPSKSMHLGTRTQINTSAKVTSNAVLHRYVHLSFHHSYSIPPSRSLRRRINKRLKSASKPVLDEAQFQRAVSQLPPRFTGEELCNVMTLQEDPLVCLGLFNWASQQPRFRHDVSTYHITVKKLGAAKLYQEMDDIVNQVLAVPHIGSEVLYNTIIYFFIEDRKLTKAVNIYKHARNSKNVEWRPSIRTYNLLFSAFLSRGRNSYINHMYMQTIRCLFKQMVNDGVEPDIFSLNSMIKGYVLSLHVNDALRIFHQMGVVYNCLPNSYSYDYLIHGLCAQGRTKNARELCNEMKGKGFVPSGKSYNSLVNSLALCGEVDEAVNLLWEMTKNQRSADLITYQTVLDEICRQQRVGDATRLLEELQEKELVDNWTYRKLLHKLEDNLRNRNDRIDSGIEIQKYVDNVTPQYKPKFDALNKIDTMTADEYFEKHPEVKKKLVDETRNDYWGY